MKVQYFINLIIFASFSLFSYASESDDIVAKVSLQAANLKRDSAKLNSRLNHFLNAELQDARQSAEPKVNLVSDWDELKGIGMDYLQLGSDLKSLEGEVMQYIHRSKDKSFVATSARFTLLEELFEVAPPVYLTLDKVYKVVEILTEKAKQLQQEASMKAQKSNETTTDWEELQFVLRNGFVRAEQ